MNLLIKAELLPTWWSFTMYLTSQLVAKAMANCPIINLNKGIDNEG